MQALFGKKKTPQEQLREWQGKLRKEMRNLEKNIRDIEKAQVNVKKEIRDAAKRNDTSSARHLALEMVRSKRSIQRIHEQKAQMNSISLHLGQNIATMRVMGHIAKSTEVMKLVNNLVSVPELSKTMMEMSKEMMKAGLIEEMASEALDDSLDTEEMEEEAEEEINKVLDSIAVDTKVNLPNASTAALPSTSQAAKEENLAMPEGFPAMSLGANDEAELAALRGNR